MSVSVSPLTSVHPARNPNGRPLTVHEMWKISRVGKPAVAPNGEFLIVPVTNFDVEKNRGLTRLWRVPTSGGDATPLTSAESSSSDPCISPDSEWLLFLRKKDPKDKAQLYRMPLNGGEPEVLTDMPLGVMDPRWFPDGKRIAFVTHLTKGKDVDGTREVVEERDKSQMKARVSENRVVRFWDNWRTDEDYPHIFVMELDSRELVNLNPDEHRWSVYMEASDLYDIAPDGEEIVYSATHTDPPYLKEIRTGIYTVPTKGGKVKCLTDDHPAGDYSPKYSPDGRSILYGMQHDPHFYADRVQLILRDRKTGKEEKILPNWDRSASAWAFTKDGKIVLEAEDNARHKLWTWETGTTEPKELVGEGTATSLSVGNDGYAYFAHGNMSDPMEIKRIAVGGGTANALTSFNQWFLDEVALGEVYEIEFKGADDKPVQAYVITPPNFDADKKYPMVHVIHGGPHGISGDYFHPRWNGHAFTTPGYVSVQVNFHGSTSWGQDFAKCIQGAHGDKPFQDVMKCTDAVLETGFIDENRMAATGASYGGYMIAWIAGHTDRFRCLVNHAGVYNILSQYASDVTHGRHASYGGEPWDGLENIDKYNPARYTDGFKTPMLISHGEKDYRVPVTQGLECYGVMKAKGIDARLIYFPDENHWILKPQNSIFWYGEVMDWLARYLDK